MYLLRGQFVTHFMRWSGFFGQKLYSVLGPTSGQSSVSVAKKDLLVNLIGHMHNLLMPSLIKKCNGSFSYGDKCWRVRTPGFFYMLFLTLAP